MWTVGRFSRTLFALCAVAAALACGRTRTLTQSEAEQAIREYVRPFVVDSLTDVTMREVKAPKPMVLYSATLAAHDGTGTYALPHADFYFQPDEATGAYALDPSFSGAKAALFDMKARHAAPSLPDRQKQAVDRWAVH